MTNSRRLLLATALTFTFALPATVVRAQDSGIPTPEESRAALLEPISTQPSLGNEVAQPSPPTTSGSGVASGSNTAASGEPPPSGPIGAVGETIPAKFSKRNDILDRTPIMAFPLKLSDEERRQIYQAVMADKGAPAAGAEALMPASELSTEQALEGMHPLPESLHGIAQVRGYKYVKAKDKVLLVEPSTRTVVDQITS